MAAFREIDHSGDVGIEAAGSDLANLLENLTRGLFSLQYRGRVGCRVERVIEVDSRSVEDLVVDWLADVIAVCGTYGELYSSVSISDASDRHARGILIGESFDETVHDPRFDVKAVTYHGLDVAHDDGGWRARVVFDL